MKLKTESYFLMIELVCEQVSIADIFPKLNFFIYQILVGLYQITEQIKYRYSKDKYLRFNKCKFGFKYNFKLKWMVCENTQSNMHVFKLIDFMNV